jgi:hypothetical protein
MKIYPGEAEALDKILKSGLISHSSTQRLRVIQHLFVLGRGRSETKRDLQVSFPFIDRWRDRWKTYSSERAKWFCPDNQGQRSPATDREFILSIVTDIARSGTPAKFGEEMKNRIIAIALQKPSELGVPIERWSHELLARYLMEQGIVDTISSTTVGDFLKSAPGKSPQE